MSENFMPFAKPEVGEEEIAAVAGCFQSGWLTTGPQVAAFEKQFAQYCQAEKALAFSSATAALTLVCQALFAPGDEVITTPLTFVATANSISLSGAKPVFVDIDPQTLNLDWQQVEAAITSKTRGIMPVHFAGLPVDCDKLYQLAEKYQLRVIEDCAHAVGSCYREKIIGSFGDIQVFSFHPNKNMTAAEGGMLICRDTELQAKLSVLRFHGIDREAWNRYGKKGSLHYDVISPGFKYNMMDIQAAIGLIQLQRVDGFNQQRNRLVERYYGLLRDWPQWQLPAVAVNYPYFHSWHMFNPLLQSDVVGFSRDEFINKMKQHNIGVGLHYLPVHLFSFYQERYGYKQGQFPQAERIGERIVSLPLFSAMTDAEQDRVIVAMQEVFQR